MSDYVVYVHQNKTNGKRYIGITNNTTKRWSGQGKRYEDCPRFNAAIKKYGWDDFTHEILEEGLTLEEANRLEQEYIAKYKTQDKRYGYNINPGGDFVPSRLGKHHTEATKQKLREAALGHEVSEEQRRKLSEAMKGRFCGDLNAKSTKVRCITTGEIFESQRIAAKETGVQQSSISRCCNGIRKQSHGLEWEYVEA